jgi:hypothetical protein
MYVQVDLASQPPVVSLAEADDTKRFHVEVLGGTDVGRLFGALVDAAAGRLEGDDAWIALDAVRRMAAGQVAPDWNERFDAMLEYARTRGWLDEAAHTVRAHVEWRDDASG